MDKNQKNSRRALAGNIVFAVIAAVVLLGVKAFFPSTPTWVLLLVFGLCCLGLVGDLINLIRLPR
jgi:hypothetical protein